MAENFDIVVIGGGPGGARAARRCAQRGAKVALIEKEYLGGVCLNWGCIPTKVLLASAETLLKAKKSEQMGINIPSASPDWSKIQQRKEKIVADFRKGMASSICASKVNLICGKAIVISANYIKVETDKGLVELETKNIIIATGSQPAEIPAFRFDGKTIISSTEALSLPQIPESMLVVGGGFIGCEIGCFYAAMGTKVTIVEALSCLLPREDNWVGRLLEREFKKIGIDVFTKQKVVSVNTSGTPAKASLESGMEIIAEKVLVAVGSKAYCDEGIINALKLEMNGSAIRVNEKFQTNVHGVYAVGDCIGTSFLAHGATTEAEIAAKNIFGGDEKMYDYSLIPRAIFTFPEVAGVGKTEQQCRAEGLDIAVGKGFFRSDGRSVAINETAGEVRAIRDKKTNKIIGITMVGPMVTELVVLARTIIGTQEKFSNICFPHPTVSEVLQDAIENAFSIK
jgi:dihydrolipoamide dehydrogenase